MSKLLLVALLFVGLMALSVSLADGKRRGGDRPESNFKTGTNGSRKHKDSFEYALSQLTKQGKKRSTQPFVDLTGTTWCPYTSLSSVACNSTYKYQTFDGQCNNLANPYYGRSEMPFVRYLQPAYADGTSAARVNSVSGAALPNVRTTSITISPPTPNTQILAAQISHYVALFGQFLAHDIAGTAAITGIVSLTLFWPFFIGISSTSMAILK